MDPVPDADTLTASHGGRATLSKPSSANTPKSWWIYFAAAVIALRAVVGVIVWKRLLFAQADEDLGRYWWFTRLLRMKFWEGDNPGFVEKQFAWVSVSPWLPLHPYFFEQFLVFGDWHAPLICAAQTLFHAAATLLIARTAWHLTGERMEGAILGAIGMFSVLRLNIIGTGFLTEPMFYLSLSGMSLGAVLLGRGPGSPGTLAGFWCAVVAGELLRYEAWLFAGACILVIALLRHGRDIKNFLRTAFTFGLGTLVVPALWLLLNLYISGDPLHFLSQTREHFDMNVSHEGRGSFALKLWSGQQFATVLVFALTLAALWKGNAAVRASAGLAVFLAITITALNSMGMGGFSFPERYWIAAYVLGVPAAAAMMLMLISWRGKLPQLKVVGILAVVVLGVAFFRLSVVQGYLERRYDYPALHAAISLVKSDPAATQKTLLWMDDYPRGWHQVLPNLQIPERWESYAIPTDDPLLRRDSDLGPRVVLMNPGKVKWRESNGAIPPPYLPPSLPWEIYLFTSGPIDLPKELELKLQRR